MKSVSGIRFDHIAIAVPSLAAAPAFLVGVLGGVPAFGANGGGFRFGQWRFANRARIEVLEPAGRASFLHRFLAAHGPGVHHVTFKVPSLAEACARAEARGYSIVGYDDSYPSWKEAFLHPKQALGIVVQFAEEGPSSGAPPPWVPPPAPAAPPSAVTLIGLRMRAHRREGADAQWSGVLGGERTETADGGLVYRWSRSPLQIVVEIDPVADEGPLAVEFAAERNVDVPAGRHPVLGAVFTRVPLRRE
ncbi:MAG TPA: VOC family protein [Methylomirabilota bacterium]|jgi:methylmalonyl-CoA/ethylmalonyl-CoA epimerase